MWAHARARTHTHTHTRALLQNPDNTVLRLVGSSPVLIEKVLDYDVATSEVKTVQVVTPNGVLGGGGGVALARVLMPLRPHRD